MAPSGSLRRTQVAGGGDAVGENGGAVGAGLLGVAVGVLDGEVGVPVRAQAGVGGGFDGAGGEAGDDVSGVPQDDFLVFVLDVAAAGPVARPVQDLAVEDRGVEGVAGVQPGPGGRGVTPGLPVRQEPPCQIPKTAPSRSAASAPRPVCRATGPTATVAPRSRMRAAVTSASSTAKYGVQATATGGTAPAPRSRPPEPRPPAPPGTPHRATRSGTSSPSSRRRSRARHPGRGPSGSPSTEPRTRRRSNRRAGADPRWYRHCSVTASRKPSLSGIRHTGT